MLPRLSLLSLFISSVLWADNSVFDPAGPSQSDFGGVGLLQMPTARMAKMGEFSANYIDDKEYRRWSISVQPFDWFEATIRYTDVRSRLYSNRPEFSGDQTYKDKGMDFKFSLWEESGWVPAISLGMRDLMGTGLFDSEYIVASKRFGAFDFTLGMGWGNMAESGNIKNPFCTVSDSWCLRNSGYSGSGGKFEFGNMFHGQAALFGGIEYQTPWKPLRFKLEYDGNDYSNEFSGEIEHASSFNIGAVYRIFDNVDTHLSYQRGNALMWGITLRTNFNELNSQHVDVPKADYQPDKVPVNMDMVDWARLAQDMRDNAGWKQVDVYGQGNSITISGEQIKYRDKGEALSRTSLLAINQLPNDISELHVISRNRDFELGETVVELDSVRRVNTRQTLGKESRVINKEKKVVLERRPLDYYKSEPDLFSFSFSPSLTQSFGGAESFYMYQLGVNANSELKLTDRDRLQSSIFFNVVNNYDDFNYKAPPPDGEALPRVRTWVREYVDSSDILLNTLQLTRFEQFSPEWYGQIYGGYLEMMYAGVGGEIFYRPYDKSWAIGSDVNWVRQRDWNNTLNMADYDVVTGHLTSYWQLPFIDGVMSKISVGRYLAGDLGVTVDLSRQFDSGIIMGAYATITNVSAEEYGEGSFTKGFYITIPFDLMLIKPTTNKGTIGWVPLTRDGGQMLNRTNSLYSLTD